MCDIMENNTYFELANYGLHPSLELVKKFFYSN